MASTSAITHVPVRAAAERLLETYTAAADPARSLPDQDQIAREARALSDSGPAILATLLAGPERPASDSAAGRALAAWLRGFRRPAPHVGLHGCGATARMFSLRIASATWPRLAQPLARQRDMLSGHIAGGPWRTEQVGWSDYDLITGAAGVLVAFAADPDADAAARAPLVAHLTRLCEGAELGRLRVGQYLDDHLRGWNYGRINLGLAHGLPGILAALTATADVDGLGGEARDVVRRLADRLVAESYTDGRGVITWPFGTRRLDGHRASRGNGRRQAWCYGGPGNAWVLWEAARVLEDDELGAFAVESARSFLNAYDDAFYLDSLGICHGAAGLMLVYDAFARHTPLTEAAKLADHLAGHLRDSLDAVADLGDMWLQGGSTGVLAALLTVEGGDRRWLAALALR
ncbi:lanthionine synthetase LanC family protein [Nonomuraea sp. NPDC050643]|uniref:lanthionine synthetase LanC family protein n=1 Tax=Nonomuraea sp. NPDC050643 TaxID=3155660 RepID=UPI003410469F